jgi:hypothetical protein
MTTVPKTYTVTSTAYVGVTYPNKALTEICEQLMDDYGLSPQQIANLSLDIIGECENINEARSEAYWMDRSAPDDSSYRRDIINAGRGHLLK